MIRAKRKLELRRKRRREIDARTFTSQNVERFAACLQQVAARGDLVVAQLRAFAPSMERVLRSATQLIIARADG